MAAEHSEARMSDPKGNPVVTVVVLIVAALAMAALLLHLQAATQSSHGLSRTAAIARNLQ
jgi:hypothetical protein